MSLSKFYEDFGRLTVAFAQMEAHLRIIISGLAFPEDSVAASVFLDRSQLGETIQTFRKLGRRYWDCSPSFDDVAKALEKVRTRRNLFIHGTWNPGSYGELRGAATVTDFRTEFRETDSIRTWTHSKQEKFSDAEFGTLLGDVNLAIIGLGGVCAWLEREEDIEFSSGGVTSIGKPIILDFADEK